MRKSVLSCAVATLLAGAVVSTVTVFGQGANQTPDAGGGTGNGLAPGAQATNGVQYYTLPGFTPVRAGGERTVVLTGKTYLNGILPPAPAPAAGGGGGGGGGQRGQRARTIVQLPAEEALTWAKASGPGDVTFENGDKLVATAKFSKVGDYELKLVSTLGDATSTDTLKVHVVSPSTAKPLTSVPTTNFTLDSTLWNDRIKSHIVGWIPHCIDYIEHTEKHPNEGPGGLDNFIDAGRKLKGEPVTQAHRGYVFSNAWVHNIVESMSLALMVDAKGDPEILKSQADMRETLERWIPIIIAAQEPDGYIQTAHTLGLPGGRGGGTGPRMWDRWTEGSRGNHEGYTQGYFLESAIANYYMTKGQDMRLYNAAKKCADCWESHIGAEPGKQVWYDGHQEMEKALVRFGRLVNDVEGAGKGEKYIKLAKFLLDSRSTGRNPQEYDQSHVPVIRQYEAVGHAVRAAYTYAGMSAVMAETGDIDYQSATLSLWDNTVNKKLYITGGVGSGETSEGYGPNYSLRNNAYCESCANCGELFFQYNMDLAYHDAKYVSLYEDTLYNAILGDTDLKGTVLCYTNPLAGTNNRQVWQGCPCCVGNTPRALLSLPTWTYATGDSELYVNLFVGSTMNIDKFMGTSVQMVQKTNYPWDGNVAITVNPKVGKHFALKVAVPNRNVGVLYTATPVVNTLTSIAVNGTAIKNPIIENGYVTIDRDWKAGDKVELSVPLVPQIVKADPRVQANVGLVAVRFGPLVYNIEEVDGNNTTTGLAANAKLSTEWRPELLNGVMVIKGKFADGQDMLAVPNYARSNRQMPVANAADAGGGAQRAGRPSTGRFAVWMKEAPLAAPAPQQ